MSFLRKCNVGRTKTWKSYCNYKMTKNQRRKHEQVNATQSSDSRVSEDKIENKEKKEDFPKPEDFPKLHTSHGSGGRIFLPHSSGNQHCEKPWLSIVNKKSFRNDKTAFPVLPGSGHKQHGSNLNTKIHDGVSPPVSKKECAISENVLTKVEAKDHVGPEKKEPNIINKIPVEQHRNPHKKKRSDPIFFDFQHIHAIQRKKRVKKQNIFKGHLQRQKTKELLSGNYLDSSNPIRSRGKHREIKKEKLTKLKLVIIKERIIKQKMKEKEITDYLNGNECFQVIEKIDFKTEIKAYLDELNKKKAQKSENNRNQSDGTLKLKKGKQAQENKNLETVIKEENLHKVVPEKKIPQIVNNGEIKFTSKFREYCDNVLTPALNSSVSDLLKDLVKLQDRLFNRDPIKAKAKRRHVSGIREVKKYLTLKKAKLIIIAPNLEKVQMEGGVFDSINEIKSMATEQNVPYAFALDRFGLGRCTRKNVSVSAIAVLNPEGAEASFQSTLHHLREAKERFLELTKINTKNVELEDVNAKVISSLMSAFQEGLKVSDENDNSES